MSIEMALRESGPRQPFPGTRRRRCRCSLPGLTGFTGGRRGVTDADRRRLSPRWVADTMRPTAKAKIDVRGTVRGCYSLGLSARLSKADNKANRGNHKIQETTMSRVPAFATVDPFDGMTGD